MYQRLFTTFINGLLVVLFASLLLTNNAYKAPLIILAVFALGYFVYYWAYQKWQPIQWQTPVNMPWFSRWLLVLFVSYFLVYVFYFFYHQADLRHLDMPSKFLGFSLLLFFLTRYSVRYHYVLLGINLAAIVGGIVAIQQVYYLNHNWAFDDMMKIQAGDIAMSLGLFSALIAGYYRNKQSPWFYFAALAAILGITASFLSETRGAWVCLPLLILYVLWAYRQQISGKVYLLLIAAVVALAVYLFYINPSPRVQQAISDITNYANNSKNTSVGIRFELWKSAIYSWQEKPWFGWGEQAIFTSQAEQVKQGLIADFISNYRFHAHSQYFEALSRRGLLGFVMFSSLLIVPFVVFHQLRKHHNTAVQLLANMGILHVFLIATYCLTQAFFAHHSGTTFYLLVLVVLAAAITAVIRDEQAKPSSQSSTNTHG